MRRSEALRYMGIAALAFSLVTGCGGPGDTGTTAPSPNEPSVESTPADSAADPIDPSDEETGSEASDPDLAAAYPEIDAMFEETGEDVPAGFPENVNCDSIGTLIPTVTGDLYQNTDQYEGIDLMTCAWSDVPLDTSVPSYDDLSTSLDIIVGVRFLPHATPPKINFFCTDAGSTVNSQGVESFDGETECAGGELRADEIGDSGVWASIPYFDITIMASCDMSKNCGPTLPPGFTDEAGYQALRAIADELINSLEFVSAEEKANASDGGQVVQGWADAFFPGVEEDSQWYCDSYTQSTQGFNWLVADLHNGFAWTLGDEPLDNGSTNPEYLLEFADDAAGAYTSYRIAVSSEGCIADTQSGAE